MHGLESLSEHVLALAVQASMGAVLAATIAVTTPMAYAAPFETGTNLAPLGELPALEQHCNL